MLRIYWVALDVVRLLVPVIAKIKQRDANLADHIDRSSTAVVLLIAEGGGLSGGNRRLAYQRALGEMREVRGGLDAAEAKKIVKVSAELSAKIEHVTAVLVKLTR